MPALRREHGSLWRNPGARLAALLFAALALLISSSSAHARPVSASIVVDAATGQVLSESNADVLTYPASLTKMMTLYLTFEALAKGKLQLGQALPVSYNAASQAPTKLGLIAGQTLTVSDAVLGMIIKSANDAAMVAAEAIGGSESGFAQMMNIKARALGMTETYFHNPNGLPDSLQHTTARDLAKLATALPRDFPQYYHYFSQTAFTFRGRTLMTHNRFVLRYPGADGLKTGYINLSGFNLASSAVHNGRRLVGVVLGGTSPSMRDAQMWALLDAGFGTSTPKSQNNSLLLAAASGATLVPTLKPDDVSQGEDDAAGGDGDSDNAIAAASQIVSPTPVAAAAPAVPPAQVPQLAILTPSQPASISQPATVAPSASLVAVLAQLAQSKPSQPAAVAEPAQTTKVASAGVPSLRPLILSDSGDDEMPISATSGSNRFWGVQVGAYSHYGPARQAAQKAQANLPQSIRTAQIAVDEADSHNGKLYRARLVGLAQDEAAQACRQLHARQLSCLVVQSRVAMAMGGSQ